MSSSELLLTFFVALVVFGPNKLPMLAEHLARILSRLNFYKQQASEFWQIQLNEQQLRENSLKAEQADRVYGVEKTITKNCAGRGNDTRNN